MLSLSPADLSLLLLVSGEILMGALYQGEVHTACMDTQSNLGLI